MKTVWILALKELRDGLRNRWVAAAILLLGTLALALSFLGSAPTGSVKVNALEITVVSLASLSVYLIPLIALMLSFDSLVGEFERGTMMLLLTYPVKRWQVIMGKFFGHILILFIAIVVGYGGALLIMIMSSETGSEGWHAYLVMMSSSLLLGAAFISLGYLVSVIVKERATAAGAAMAVWLLFVVIYDLLLFGVLMLDEQQLISQQLISVLMLISPTDSYRIFNLNLFDGVRQASGIANIVSESGIRNEFMPGIIMLWIMLPLGLTQYLFNKREL